MTTLKRNKTRGFTLVELMIVVAIVAVLATLAIYGVMLYFENAKTTEAKNAIGMISKSAVMAYQEEKSTTEALKAGGAYKATTNAFCEAAEPVPADVPKGTKYQSAAADWKGNATTGWKCLKFSLNGPQYYQYHYVLSAAKDMFAAGAVGDLSGSGAEDKYTTLRILGKVETGTDSILLSPSILEGTGATIDTTEPAGP